MIADSDYSFPRSLANNLQTSVNLIGGQGLFCVKFAVRDSKGNSWAHIIRDGESLASFHQGADNRSAP